MKGTDEGLKAVSVNVLMSDVAQNSEGFETAGITTGFQPLDQILGGGIRPGELYLVGGNPGVGKTLLLMQWARHIAQQGTPVTYACFEHNESTILGRLLALELGERRAGLPGSQLRSDEVDLFVRRLTSGRGISTDQLDSDEIQQLRDSLQGYGDLLRFTRGAGSRTKLSDLERYVANNGDRVLFVDYLQKVSADILSKDESEKVTYVVEGLKDLALQSGLAIVAVVAADRDALRARRLRLHHLRGSSALAYEADVVVLLNEKRNAVSNVHLEYDQVKAQTYDDYVVFSIEKNRGGPTPIELEFRKDFGHFRFDPDGGFVNESLIDELVTFAVG